MANDNNNKDVANSLNKYSETAHKGTNILLNSVDEINKWYAEQLNKMTEGQVPDVRLETNVDNTETEEEPDNIEIISKIETKVEKYNEIQTSNKSTKGKNLKFDSRLQIQNISIKDINDKDIADKPIVLDSKSQINKNLKVNKNTQINKNSKRLSTAIKGVKSINNAINKLTKTGKNLNTAINEGGLKSFENTSSRIMTKPVKQITKKATNKISKSTKKTIKKARKKVAKRTRNVLLKTIKVMAKIIEITMKNFISMLPSIAPVLIIILIITCFCNFFGMGMSEDTKKAYETYMMQTQDKYDKETVAFYNEGKIVEGSIEGKGMINWKAPLSILQVLNGDLTFDLSELEMLENFDKAGLFEKITDEEYTYEKEITETDEEGNETKTTETITETKKIITYSSLDDCIKWCNKNFSYINKYKKNKKVDYNPKQKAFTDEEIEQIRLLYNSNSFFDLFGSKFIEKYAYYSVSITDEQIQTIYDEFIKNIGKRYVLDHSNLKYDECMDYYDCSSWVIHCLAHTGIKKIPNTDAEGIYDNYCVPVNEEDRQAGDLIFLKNTYDVGTPKGISHIGIYMGELTINGDTSEWVIDTGGNPTGVKIRKYNNGWWNGSHFYGFGRLKENK